MGIPLTGNITQFQSKLIAKGCTLDKISSANASNGLRIFNGSFAGNKVKIIVFYNPQNKIVYRAKALLDGVSEDRAEQEYYNLKSATKSFNLLLACTCPLVTEFADN